MTVPIPPPELPDGLLWLIVPGVAGVLDVWLIAQSIKNLRSCRRVEVTRARYRFAVGRLWRDVLIFLATLILTGVLLIPEVLMGVLPLGDRVALSHWGVLGTMVILSVSRSSEARDAVWAWRTFWRRAAREAINRVRGRRGP